MSNAKLVCRSCRKELGLKANILNNHLQSEKRKASKHKLEGKEAQERDVAASLIGTIRLHIWRGNLCQLNNRFIELLC